MKKFLLTILLISGCSSWKQKDFKKELEKPAPEAAPVVTATTEKEEKILEKFEVKPTAAPVEEVKAPVKAAEKKPAPKPIVKPQPAKKEAPKPVVKSLPADYPPELIALNAKAKKVWDLYRPNPEADTKVFLDIHYLGMTVGKVAVENRGKKKVNDKEVWHFHARLKSAPFYSNIYELDDTIDTYVTTDQFLSIRYSLIQRESKQDVDDLQLHDRDQLKTFWFYHQKKSDGSLKDKKAEKPIPFYSIDPFSVLFFYQGLPLANGDVYEIPLINKGKILSFRSVVEGREVIETAKGDRKSIRVHATTKYTGETLKSGDLFFWFSDDNKRTLLKAQAKIKIGSVTGEIVE